MMRAPKLQSLGALVVPKTGNLIFTPGNSGIVIELTIV